MASKKGKKTGKKVKSLPVKSLSGRQARDVKGGVPPGPNTGRQVPPGPSTG